ncbi:MAG: NlpC/P60 family protein [Candidatus Omnitrophica bacterium]|nr:NlpC/P60 family protein [Candidatus Omnitrophota bacterium]
MKKLDTELINKMVGIKWREDGRDCSGTDCVGLMQLYFSAKGVEGVAPKISEFFSENQDEIIKKIIEVNTIVSRDELAPEDVMVFKINDELHVGLYLGYGRMLHAKKDGKSRISRLTPSWEKYFLFAIREKDGKIYIPPAGPPAAIAVALVIADYAAASFIAGGLIALSLTTIGCLIGTAMIGYSIGLAIQARQTSKSGGSSSSPRYQFGELQTTSSNQYPVPVLYGEARLAGNIVFQSPVTGGEQVDMLIVLCEGEIDSISDVRINGEAIGNFPGCSYHAFTGTSAQNVETVTGLNLDGVQYRNTAMLHVHLETSDKLKGGRPNITCICRGRKVQVWNGSAWSAGRSYSDNPSACIRDYLLLKPQVGGCGYLTGDIDDMPFGEVYDYCAELVSDGQGGQEARYAVSYVIDQKRAASDNLTEMLVGFAGALIRSGSKLKLLVAKTQSVVASFDEDDITDLKIIQKGLDQKINRFGIEYFDPEQDDARILAWGSEDKVDQDERGLVEQTLTIPSINRRTQASRLSNQYFYELKLCPLSVEFTTSLNAIGQEIGDVIEVTHSLMGWTNKQFIIQRIEEDEKDVYKITAQEYNSSIYNDRHGATIETFDYGTPANPYAAITDVGNLIISESDYYLHKDGTVGSDILVSFDAPADDSRVFLSHYQIELKKGAGDYNVIGTTNNTNFTIYGVEDEQTYYVKVKTVSVNGIISDGTVSLSLTVLGKLSPPASVSNFGYTFTNEIVFKWDRNTEKDLAGYEIRLEDADWGVQNSNLIYNGLSNKFTIVSPASRAPGTYYIRAFDTSGNYSATSQSVTPTNAAPEAPVISALQWFGFAKIDWSDVSDADLKYYSVYKSNTNAWAGEEVLAYKTPGTAAIVQGNAPVDAVADSTGAAGMTDATLIGKGVNYFVGDIVSQTSGTHKGQFATVTAFNNSTGEVSVASWPSGIPEAGDQFAIKDRAYYKVRAVDSFGPGADSSAVTIDFTPLAESEISDEVITARKLIAGELITLSAQIKDLVVTNAKILSLDGSKITAESITLSKLAADAIPPKTYYQDNEPVSGMNEGDYWIDTNDSNKLYVYQSSAWVVISQSGGGGGGITVFKQAAIPVSLSIADLWIDTDDGDKLYRAAIVGADQIASGEWELINAATATGWAHGSDITKIDGGKIYTDSITADKINVNQLDALSTNTGTLTVDESISVGAGRIVIDGVNNIIKVYDNGANLRVELGDLP